MRNCGQLVLGVVAKASGKGASPMGRCRYGQRESLWGATGHAIVATPVMEPPSIPMGRTLLSLPYSMAHHALRCGYVRRAEPSLSHLPPAVLLSLPLIACMGQAVSAAAPFAAADQVVDSRVPPLSPTLRAPPGTGGIMAAPGDAEKAVREQFGDAERRGSPQAYILFAERHPDHPLAREARRRSAALYKVPPS